MGDLEYKWPSRLSAQDKKTKKEFLFLGGGIEAIEVPDKKLLRLIYGHIEGPELRRMVLFGAQTGFAMVDLLALNAHLSNHTTQRFPFDSIKEQLKAFKSKLFCVRCDALRKLVREKNHDGNLSADPITEGRLTFFSFR